MIISIQIPTGARNSSGTHRNRMVCRARRANSGESDGRRTWDGGLCAPDPRVDQGRDGRTRGAGTLGKTTRWTRLGWGTVTKGQRSNSS